MGKLACVVLMAIGVVLFFASRWSTWFTASTLASGDPSAFETTAYWYLASFVGIALILLGGVLLGVVVNRSPPRIPKRSLASFDDLPHQANEELRTKDSDEPDRR
jgi:hypothetical protein